MCSTSPHGSAIPALRTPASDASHSAADACSVALALGGGGARGLAHLGVLEVLNAEGIRPAFIAGTSIGGLIGALAARSIPASEIISMARGFRFPRRFIPGRMLGWHEIFPTAIEHLDGVLFGDLRTPLAISAVDLERGEEAILHEGPLLPAVRATCAVPGVLAPELLDGRYLVDGGVLNVLPVDLAWSWEPDVVVAVNILGSPRQTVRMDSTYARCAVALGRVLPNPLSAHLAFEIAMRAVEIALDRQRALAIAMTGPEVLIDIDLGDVTLQDFRRLDEVVEVGRRATLAAMPRLYAALAGQRRERSSCSGRFDPHIDPVCRMVISPGRARATITRDAVTYYFCSANCRDHFERHGVRCGGRRSPEDFGSAC